MGSLVLKVWLRLNTSLASQGLQLANGPLWDLSTSITLWGYSLNKSPLVYLYTYPLGSVCGGTLTNTVCTYVPVCSRLWGWEEWMAWEQVRSWTRQWEILKTNGQENVNGRKQRTDVHKIWRGICSIPKLKQARTPGKFPGNNQGSEVQDESKQHTVKKNGEERGSGLLEYWFLSILAYIPN